MGNRTNNNPLQDILEELHCIRTRKQELIVQLSAILCTGDEPAQPRIRIVRGNQPRLPRIRLIGPNRRRFHLPPEPVPEERDFVLDSLGNRLQVGDHVRFTGTPRNRAGTGRVTGWTGPLQVPDPYIYITCDVPRGVRYVGCRDLYRKIA